MWIQYQTIYVWKFYITLPFNLLKWIIYTELCIHNRMIFFGDFVFDSFNMAYGDGDSIIIKIILTFYIHLVNPKMHCYSCARRHLLKNRSIILYNRVICIAWKGKGAQSPQLLNQTSQLNETKKKGWQELWQVWRAVCPLYAPDNFFFYFLKSIQKNHIYISLVSTQL